MGYLKDGDNYRKILNNGQIGSKSLTWSKVDQVKPISLVITNQVP